MKYQSVKVENIWT